MEFGGVEHQASSTFGTHHSLNSLVLQATVFWVCSIDHGFGIAAGVEQRLRQYGLGQLAPASSTFTQDQQVRLGRTFLTRSQSSALLFLSEFSTPIASGGTSSPTARVHGTNTAPLLSQATAQRSPPLLPVLSFHPVSSLSPVLHPPSETARQQRPSLPT